MSFHRLLALSALLVLPACGSESAPATGPDDAGASSVPPRSAPTTPDDAPAAPKPQGPPPTIVPELPAGAEPVQAMYATIDALFERPEHDAQRVVVQHCLVGVGAQFGNRGPAEAEKVAAQLLQELAEGAKFEDIVRNNTNDAFPGVYVMLASGQPNYQQKVFLRSEMAKAFGDAAWRLRVGEVGITPYDPRPHELPGAKGTSPFGMHIIKRLQ